MVRIARDSGVTEVADPSMKGSKDAEQTKEVKEKFLTYVSESVEKGKTTIHFNNHGGPDHQWLSSGQAGSEKSDDLHRPEAISYVELGDALLEREKLDDVTIMIDSCYSNDFKNNLYNYLNTKGSTTLPVIITETNRGQVGFVGEFTSALEEIHSPGKPLTGADMYKVESKTFERQDLSITIPVKDPSAEKWADQNLGPVIDLGSTYDDGASLPPTKAGEIGVIETTTQPMPSTVLEIAATEQAAEEAIGFA